jgi:hypothetical protein
MSVSYISQKIKSKTLETTTEVMIDGEKLEILTDNRLGIKEIKVINDGTVINTITDSLQLSKYENRIFDAVIQSGICENIVQLANSLRFHNRIDGADNISNIQAVLTTIDETRVIRISLFIENDESRNIQVSFNDNQWNIAVNQEDKNLVKYARILKHKLSAIPEKVFSINFEQLLLVSELGKPIMETPLKDMIESYVEYPNFPPLTPDDDEYTQIRYRLMMKDDYKYDDFDTPSKWPKERKFPHEKEKNSICLVVIRDSICDRNREYGYQYHMNRYNYPLQENSRYNCPINGNSGYRDLHEYEMGDDGICNDLQVQEKKFMDDFQQIKFDYLNDCKNIFNHQNRRLNNDFNVQIFFLLLLLFKSLSLQDKSKITNIHNRLFVRLSVLLNRRIEDKFYKNDNRIRVIDINFITEINPKKMSEYINKILINLDAVSGTRLFSSIAEQITDFNDILDNSENLSSPDFYQRIYQQTIKSFQNNPEKIEMILADFYKLTQEPIFASSFTILNTSKTSFINAIKSKSSTTLETTIQINSVFPETITGIFIANDEPNTDTQLSIIVAEGVKRTIESKNISIYQNKLFQELFLEVVDPAQISDFTNTLKFLTKESSNNQYTGILSSNDESYPINYRLIPTHQNQYTLHLQSTQFNWSNNYQVNLDRQTFVNFLNRLDSELVDFIESLENAENLLNKAITLTPYPENDFYSGYLTTQNQNNKIDYRIDIDAQNHQTSFTLTTNNHTWNYQLDTANINQRNLIKHINPSFALQMELDESLNALLNNDNIQAVIICRHNNTSENAISIYSEVSDSSPELTVLIPTSNIDTSLNNILGNSQILRIEKYYLEGSCHYKLSFPNYDANAKQIKLTQQINSSGRIQVQTTEADPVKILDDQGNIQITHHRDQVSSEIKEVEHEGFVEDANFTYHASGQLIISNLPAGITIEHYVKPPIQNILNGLEEAFIFLKSGDQITFLADDNLAKLTIRLI